jgi:hypothetical protein
MVRTVVATVSTRLKAWLVVQERLNVSSSLIPRLLTQ